VKTDLDIEQPGVLVEYLVQRGVFRKEDNCQAVVLAGGVSNKTVLAKTATRGIVVKQALARLRVATEWLSDPARIRREAVGLRLLEKLAPPGAITPFVFEDEPLYLLGMEAVPEPHQNWKTMLLRGEVSDDAVHQFGALLGRIHFGGTKLDTESRRPIDDRRFFHELRVDPYYRFAAKNNPDAAAFYARLIADMEAHPTTVVHGDFSPKNILVYEGRLILLDHEVIHWGDPTFDLGFALTHLLAKANHLPAHRGKFLDAARKFWRAYVEEAGDLPEQDGYEARACRQALACLLARVDGRSPLEYLTPEGRATQKKIVLELMPSPPRSVDDLIGEFGARL
jgi:aminoglycoside phosphotransferase (APT) family kinase protein